jgi:hypothetical protein
MASNLFELDTYLIRRKVLKIFGGSFHTYDGEQVVAFTKQKAFKLKEDIRIYSDESMQTELLSIQARQVIDFAAAYDIVDVEKGVKVGAARRKGFSSVVRDSWILLDAQDETKPVVFRQHFNPFVYRLQVSIPREIGLDRRLIFGIAALIAAIEGRQK